MHSSQNLTANPLTKIDHKRIPNPNSPQFTLKYPNNLALTPTIIKPNQLTHTFHHYLMVIGLILTIEDVDIMLEYADLVYGYL